MKSEKETDMKWIQTGKMIDRFWTKYRSRFKLIFENTERNHEQQLRVLRKTLNEPSVATILHGCCEMAEVQRDGNKDEPIG